MNSICIRFDLSQYFSAVTEALDRETLPAKDKSQVKIKHGTCLHSLSFGAVFFISSSRSENLYVSILKATLLPGCVFFRAASGVTAPINHCYDFPSEAPN